MTEFHKESPSGCTEANDAPSHWYFCLECGNELIDIEDEEET